MNNKTVHATQIASNETQQTGNYQETTQSLENTGGIARRFGLADLWSIRKSARTFKIHGRIPRV